MWFHCCSSTLTVSLGWAFFHSALTASMTAGGALASISQTVRVRGPDWASDWSPSPEESPQAAAPRVRARAKARVARARRRRGLDMRLPPCVGTADGYVSGSCQAVAAVDDGALGHGDHHLQGRVEQHQVGVLARLQA